MRIITTDAKSTTNPAFSPKQVVIWVNRGMELLWLMAVLLVPLVFLGRDFGEWSSVIGSFELPKIALLRTLVALMLILWLTKWSLEATYHNTTANPGLRLGRSLSTFLRELKIRPSHWVTVTALLFFATTALSAALSPSYQVSLWGDVPGQDSYGAYTVLAYVLLFAVISTNVKTLAQVHRLVGAVILMAILVSAYSIFQYFGNDFFDLREPINTNRSSSTLGNAIFAGSVIVIAIPMCMAWAGGHLSGPLTRFTFSWKLAILSAVLAALLLGLIFTLSRGPWGGTAVALCLVFAGSLMVVERRDLARLVLVFGIAALLTIAVLAIPKGDSPGSDTANRAPQAAAQRIAAAASGAGGAAGLDGRIRLWKSSQELVFNHPWYEFDRLIALPIRPLLGYGPEMFRSAYLLESEPTTRAFLPNDAINAHNFFIHQTVEQGFLGLLTSAGLFLVPIAAGVYHLRGRRSGYSTASRLLMIGLMAAIAGRMLEQMVGVARVSDIMVFWVSLALLVVLLRYHETSADLETENQASRPRRTAPTRGSVKADVSSVLASAKFWGILACVAVLAIGVGTLTWFKSVNYVRAAIIADGAASNFSNGNLTASLESLGRAINLAPDVSTYRSIRASVFAVAVAEDGDEEILNCPQLAGSTVLTACLARHAHRWNLEWLKERPNHAPARLAAAGSALDLGMLTEDESLLNDSIRYSQEAASMIPNGWPILNYVAETYIQVDRPEEALKVLERSLGITAGTDRSYQAYLIQAEAHADLNRNDRSLVSLQKAIDVHARPQEAYAAMGLIHSEQGQFLRAVEDYSEAILLTPNVAEYYFDRGSIYYSIGRFQEAIGDFNEAIEIDPGLTVAYNNRGLAWIQQSQFQLAIDDFGLVISQEPLFALGFNNRGFAYRELGEYESAIQDLDRAIQVDPNLGIAYYNRAVAHAGLGNDSKAELDRHRAVELGIDPMVVRRGMSEVENR